MLTISPLIKIFIVFAVMLAFGRRRVPLSLTLILGGVALNYWGGNAPKEVFAFFLQALTQINLWLLVAATAFIIEFGRELANKKNTQTMLSFAQRLGGRSGRLGSLMLIPSLIGLVPMPAGALFSAPMVQQSAAESHWKAEWKVAVNYWFRHVWEYWWPIYPVVIIGMAVFKMEPWRFIITMIPFTPAAFVIGYLFLLRPHRRQLSISEPAVGHNLRQFMTLMWPLLVIILFVLLLPPVFTLTLPALDPQTSKLLAMLIGTLTGLGIIRRRSGKEKRIFASFFGSRNLNVLLTIGCIVLFQSLLGTSRLLPAASDELMRSGISVFPIVAALPFLAGLITGVASGFAGIAFPLIAGLIESSAGGLSPMATLALAFGFGYMGMMLSPIHLCLIMTRDYFSASLLPIYRQLVLCVASQIGFTIILFTILKIFKI